MNSELWIGLGTLLVAIVGLSLVVWQLREQRRGMRAEFGNLYVQRYWQIDDDLLLEPKGSDKHRQHRHRYLRLFEDEFDVAALGFLDRKQWDAWHGVLADRASLDRVKDDLSVCDPKEDSFARLRACIAQRESERRPHAVAACSSSHVR